MLFEYGITCKFTSRLSYIFHLSFLFYSKNIYIYIFYDMKF